MKILAIDSSTRRRSVALCEGVRGESNTLNVLGSSEAASERGGRFASLVAEVLDQSGIDREEVEALAVGVGPGSAAGIRSTLSFAWGWKLARNVSLMGLSSVWGLAIEAQRLGLRGDLRVVLPGPMGKLIHGDFQVETECIKMARPLELVDQLSTEQLRTENVTWVGPDLDSALAPLLESESVGQIENRRVTLFPTATALAELFMRDWRDAVRPLEPEALVSPKFVQAPPPREIPGI